MYINLISLLKFAKMNRLILFLSFSTVALGAWIPNRCLIASEGEGYIVGGKNTSITDIPYQISLHMGTRFICGGSIISATHVITAAHCVADYLNSKNIYKIRAGSSQEITGGVLLSVKKYAAHPKFSWRTLDYDAAVIELSTPLNFSASIKPIKLTDKQPPDGESVKVSGWGCLKENGPRPRHLQSVEVPMVNRKTCEKNYKEYLPITPRMICAGIEGKDACQGDSGGPLAYKNTLVGIVSTGEGCAKKDFPGIYTNVADPEVRKFIKEQANV